MNQTCRLRGASCRESNRKNERKRINVYFTHLPRGFYESTATFLKRCHRRQYEFCQVWCWFLQWSQAFLIRCSSGVIIWVVTNVCRVYIWQRSCADIPTDVRWGKWPISRIGLAWNVALCCRRWTGQHNIVVPITLEISWKLCAWSYYLLPSAAETWSVSALFRRF